jgi:serine/threonine protein kinase
MSCGAKILLKDRYRALKLLGQGGFGKTFKAVDEDQPRKPLCVIKQFAFSNNHPETRQIALKLFYEEAQHLEALGKHDQIPELLAYFDVEGQPYLVQQFIDGQDLEQELATAGTFNQAKIRELLESLLPVLDFLHHQSPPVIHRDIKPANIIRRRSDGGLVLVDFGAAKQATQSMLAKTGTAIGSAEFAAPEQARRKPVFASDIYSLGVTCIYLLTQVSPFDLFDMNQDTWVWRDYLVDNPVDEKLGKVLDKMIANVLPQRYQSVKDVLQALGIENKSPSSTHSFQNTLPQMNAEDYFNRGVVKEDEFDDFPGALADYNKAIELDPKYAPAYSNRAWLLCTQDDCVGALADYNRAIELDPKYAPAYRKRAWSLYIQGDCVGALDNYNKAIELDPDFVSAYTSRAHMRETCHFNDIDGILADCNKAIELDPRCEIAYSHRARLKCEDLNDFVGALADYNKLIELCPQHYSVYNDRAELKLKLANTKGFDRLKRWVGSFTSRSRFKFNDIDGILADYNKAIELAPNYDMLYYNRGWLKHDKLNDIAGALADYNKAIGKATRINPDLSLESPERAIFYCNRGWLKHDKLNDIAGALADYNKAIETDPDFADTYYRRGQLRADKIKDRNAAIQDFRHSIGLFRQKDSSSKFIGYGISYLKMLGVAE